LPRSPLIVLAKIARIILGLIALYIILNALFAFVYQPAQIFYSWQSAIVSLIVVWIAYWLVGKAEGAAKKREEDLQERLRGLIYTYGRVSLGDLSAKLNISVAQTEDLIARMRASGKVNVKIDGGYVTTLIGTPSTGSGGFCMKCGAALTVLDGRWWCNTCRIFPSQEPAPMREIIKEREVVMVSCRYCGARNPQISSFCTNCGAPLR